MGLRVGPPREAGTLVGPVIDEESRHRIEHVIDGAPIEPRARVDVSHLTNGYYVGPTLFADVDPMSSLGQDEIFGPVLCAMKADDFESALAIANRTRFGLPGGVYSRTPSNLDLARRAFAVGNLYFNQKITGAVVNRQPFGGMKLSGVGSKAGGPDYLQQFMLPRVVTENTLRRGFAPDAE